MEILDLEIIKPNSHTLQMRKTRVRDRKEFSQSPTALRPEPRPLNSESRVLGEFTILPRRLGLRAS